MFDMTDKYPKIFLIFLPSFLLVVSACLLFIPGVALWAGLLYVGIDTYRLEKEIERE